MGTEQINELTRQGKNPCPSCGRPKEMYYVPWCPACEKPEPRLVHVLNLIQALRHLEISGHTGIEARVCDALIEGGMLINDTCVMLALPAEGQGIEDEHTKDLLVLRQVFGLGDCVMVEISW